ncbi:MAG: SURF1 family protein [Alphaproteobacteria bacterium]|nr:SURF1 family protein [Alphaproteobacteria bacterium]
MNGFRPRLIPTLLTVPAVLILAALGLWQLQRLQWKEDLIAQRTAAAAAAPIAPPQTLAEAQAEPFRRVVAQGVFAHDKELYLAASSEGGGAGYQVLTPLRMTDGRTIIVNRGFVPQEIKEPAKRAAGQVAGDVRVAGLLRLPPDVKPTFFLPDNRPDLNLWFWIDLPAMARAGGVSDALPFYIDADKTANPGGWPKGGVTRLELPNNHLQYAITWFALGMALTVIYVLYHRSPASSADEAS